MSHPSETPSFYFKDSFSFAYLKNAFSNNFLLFGLIPNLISSTHVASRWFYGFMLVIPRSLSVVDTALFKSNYSTLLYLEFFFF